ncbi:acylaminoacyl-peptidase [Bryobacterales bacterium F-183]|nr:acylaminoacyl-peptidase [Bryobacterales bacterium F-183]
MKLLRYCSLAVATCAMVCFAAANETAASGPKPIELKDILGWKRIQSPVVSPDGQWMAYVLAPNEGDSDVIVRNVKDAKDSKYAVGEVPAGAGGFGHVMGNNTPNLAFSEDSKFVAFTVYPAAKEAKRLKKDRKPLVNKVLLVELATGKKTEFERTRRFAFNGKRGGWLAVLRTPAEGQKWQGSDMLLTELATGDQLNIGNTGDFAFDKSGDWLAFAIDAQDMVGNGVQLRNMATGAVMPLDSAKATYKSLNWTETGNGLTVLRGVEDKAFEDKLYTAIGFTSINGTAPVKTVFDPKKESSFPAGMTVSPNRPAAWTKDLSALVFGIHEVKAKKKDAKDEKKDDSAAAAPAPARPAPPTPADDKERADLVLWHWLDKRLQPQQQVQEQMDKNFSYTSIYRVAEKKFLRLADEALRQVTIPEPHVWGIGTDISKYELQGSLNGQRYSDIYSVNLATGERKLLLEKNRYYYGASPDGRKIAYYDDGHYFIKDIASGETRNVTKAVTATVFWNQEDDHNISKPPTQFLGWTKDSAAILLSDNWDMWTAPWNSKPANLTINGKKDKIRYRSRFRLDPEEKGVDFSAPVYIGMYGEWTKKGGIARLDPGAKAPKQLLWDDALFNTLVKAKNADTYFYTRETGTEYPNFLLASNASLEAGTKVTDANPQQKEKAWSTGVKLIDYTSAKGDKLQGALFLPANYEPGKKYPTIVYIYEKLSQGANAYAQPSSNGFNKSVYTSNGYAVFMPDITYKLNDPGMSAVWCILPGLDAAIATGVVDAEKVGLHGHSWGGYQTAFMVTQTDKFKAAIAGAPLTDMISMYSSIYWNTGSANQPIFESSQGRFTSSYLDNLEAYVRNSPIFHAMKVKTPLVILHNDKDGAVDFTQGIEYYNTLRRLQKQVIMLQYKGENHGLRVPANQKDYTVRMKEFFDHHLKGAAAPGWMKEGVPHLKVKEHLDERDPAPAAVPAPAITTSAGGEAAK